MKDNEGRDATNRRNFLSNSLQTAVFGGVALGFASQQLVAGQHDSGESDKSDESAQSRLSIIDLGADATGTKLATAVIQKAIDQLAAAGGGTVVIPRGTFLTGTIFLKSHIQLELQLGATLLGSPNIDDYTPMTWGHNKDRQPWHLIYADNIENAAITGLGTIDGNGEYFWQPYERDEQGRMVEPRWIKAKDKKISPLIDINNSRNIRIHDVTVKTGGGWNIHLFDCDEVQIRGVRITNSVYSPNSDAIDLSGCRDVSVSDCYIRTCDDAICLKTLPDSRTTERVAINNCVIETFCVGVKLGATESYQDMRDVSIANCTFKGTSRFFALYSKNGGMLENITVTNISGDTNAKLVLSRPIQLMVEKAKDGSIGGIRNVVIDNMVCHTDGRILITCDDQGVMENIILRNMVMTYPRVEDPQPLAAGATSNQFPQSHLAAGAARAAVVVDNAKNLMIENLIVNWPAENAAVPQAWQHLERIENGTERIHRYDYSKPKFAEFHAVWVNNVSGLYLNNPFVQSSSDQLEKYQLMHVSQQAVIN